jgi:hypothetical protein
MKSSFHILIPFLPLFRQLPTPKTWLNSLLQLPAPELDSVLLSLSLMLRPTVSRPFYLGIKHPSGAYDPIFITVRQLRLCWCGALSLTSGRVCRLQWLLALASEVILGSESRAPRDNILLSHVNVSILLNWTLRYNHFSRTKQKTSFPTTPTVLFTNPLLRNGFFYCYVIIRCSGNVLTILCLETVCITPLFIRLLQRNSCT